MHRMVTLVNVSDMSRSVAFYRDTLALKLRLESPGWSEFEVGGSTLALHGDARPSAAERGHEPVAGTAAVSFEVEDVDAAFARLAARGVRFVMAPRDRRQEGIRLAVFVDPDGFPLSVVQPLRPAGRA